MLTVVDKQQLQQLWCLLIPKVRIKSTVFENPNLLLLLLLLALWIFRLTFREILSIYVTTFIYVQRIIPCLEISAKFPFTNFQSDDSLNPNHVHQRINKHIYVKWQSGDLYVYSKVCSYVCVWFVFLAFFFCLLLFRLLLPEMPKKFEVQSIPTAKKICLYSIVRARTLNLVV